VLKLKEGYMQGRTLTACLVCGGLIEVVEPFTGKLVECPDCKEAFRVLSLQPLQLTYAYNLDDEGEFVDDDYPHC
jgi:lysine biosynthesis protein LysW